MDDDMTMMTSGDVCMRGMSPSDAGPQGGVGERKPEGRGARSRSRNGSPEGRGGAGVRAGWFSAVTVGMLVLVSCGDAEAETEDEQAGVDESPVSESEESSDEATKEGASEGTEEEPEPIPASSDGPAENWPEPEVPEEIYEETEEGVEAALEYWWEARTYARETGDTEPLEQASGADCGLCVQQIDRINETFDQDGWYVQDPIEITGSFIRIEDTGYATALLALEEGAFDTYWESDLYSEKSAEPEQGWSAGFIFEGGQWSVSDMQFVGEAEGDGGGE